MDEDSEQRKKRLKQMRLEADLAQDSRGGGGVEDSGVAGFLSNPLAEAPSTVLSTDAAPRFNYYTDPMNAFASDKRSSSVNVRPAPAPEYLPPPPNFGGPSEYLPPPPNFGGPPVARFSSPYPESTNPQMSPSPTQALPTVYRNRVWNGPRGTSFPFPPQGGGTYPRPRFESPGRPSYNSPPGMNQWPNHNPNPSSGYIPLPSSEYSPNHSPAFRNSPNYNGGRGRGFWNNTRNTMSGRGRGQGSSSHGRGSNEDRNHGPDRFYKRSMVEDPWKYLKPIIWYSTYTPGNYTPENSKPCNPSKSTSTKTEGPPAIFSKSSSGPSLAEYLASAFSEAANTEENV